MTAEVENPLTTLLRKRYGITRRSHLTITDNDTPFTIFRKVAAYIARNGDWTENDQATAIKDYLELSGMEHKVLSVKRTGLGGLAIGTAAKGMDVFEVQTQSDNNRLQTQYFVLDGNNKSWNQQGERYTHRNRDGVFWYVGNQNYTIGYGKLLRDIYNQWLKAPYKYHEELKPDDFRDELGRFVRHAYAGKKWEYMFQSELKDSLSVKEMEAATEPNPNGTDPNQRVLKQSFLNAHPDFKREYGQPGTTYYFYPRIQLSDHMKWQALTFVNHYLQSTYNIVRQQSYEHEMNTQARASAWETKKNINKATQQVMDKTVLHQYFSGVELDNDIDLVQFKRFEDETMRLMARLPRTGNQPVLRLRKLGNYNANGMYVPALNTIIVDFRKSGKGYSDSFGNAQEEARFSSFIHEYGHYLDRNLVQTSDNLSLSLQPEFANILRQYSENLKSNDVTAKQLKYFSVPTEAFARGFELYMYDTVGLRGNLNHNHSHYDGKEFQAFSPELRTELTRYFDAIPEIKVLRKTMNIDTSREIRLHVSDQRQNDPELANKGKLANFSVELLNRWTKDITSMEELITMSSRRLALANPTKVIAFDKWGTKVPQLVSQYKLHQKGIVAKRYPNVEHIRAYSKHDDGHWQPDRLYSVPQLREAMINDGRALQQLHELVDNRTATTGKKEIITKIVNKKLGDKPAATPLTKIQERVTKYLLIQNHLKEEQWTPFHFSSSEHELLSRLADTSRTKIFKMALHESWKHEPELEKELKFGINHPLMNQKQLPQHKEQQSLKFSNYGRER